MAEILGTRASPGLLRSVAFWRVLAEQPPVRVTGKIELPLSYGWTGIPEVPVEVGGRVANWAVDTGAEVSIVRASDAARFGVRWLARDLGITGSTSGVAVGGLGIIDRMRIGAAEVAHVPVMVLPDANLTFEGGVIPPILGMPLFYKFGSLEFVEHGARVRAGSSVGVGNGRPITWNSSGIAIEIQLYGGALRVHLDTGANRTALGEDAIPLLSPEQRQAMTQRTVRTAGVGGTEERQLAQLGKLDVAVAGATCQLQSVALGDDNAGAQGRAGVDLVRACNTMVLDFATMTFSAR